MADNSMMLQCGQYKVRASSITDPSGMILVRLDEGEPFEARLIDRGVYLVQRGQQRWTVNAVTSGDETWVFFNGSVLVVTAEAVASARRRSAGPHGHPLTAPMPAKVVRVVAVEGQEVKKGETLLILEAMKTELPIKAPGNGIVKKIRCFQGQIVQPDSVLIDVEWGDRL